MESEAIGDQIDDFDAKRLRSGIDTVPASNVTDGPWGRGGSARATMRDALCMGIAKMR